MSVSALDMDKSTTPLWLRIAAILGVVWYAFGLMQFWLGYTLNTASAVEQGAITAAHGAAIEGTPQLVWLAFAIASAAGLTGAALLFMRAPAAKAVFGLSLLSAALYYLWVYGISGTGADRPSEEIIIAAVVCAVTLGYFLLSRRVT